VLLMLGSAVAQADTISQILTLGSLPANDNGAWNSIATYGCFSLSCVANGSSVTTPGGNTVTESFSLQPGAIFITGSPNWTQSGWPAGSNDLLGSHDTSQAFDQLTLTFGTPVSSFGISAQDFAWTDPFTATMTVTCSAVCSGATSISVSATQSAGVYDPVFLGVSDSGASISSVVITVTGTDEYYFGVGPFALTNGPATPAGPVPEPASLVLMASGLGAFVWKARQRSRA